MKQFWKKYKWLPIYILGSLSSASAILNQGMLVPALLIILLIIGLLLYLLIIDRHD